jgi:hypothetical protein
MEELTMSDDEFLSALRDGSLPPAQFNHMGHLRLGWICLQRLAPDDAVALVCSTIASYAASLGAATKFHRTMSEALLHIMRAAGAHATTWDRFVAANPALAANARALLARHYSDALLASDAARQRFVAPDLAPLPA